MYALLLADYEDEREILAVVLQRAALDVVAGNDLERTLAGWSENPADFILVALHQPEPQTQVQRIRKEAAAPLVLVVNSVSENVHCDLLEQGADFVAVRPFSARLLVAHVRALLRRADSVPMATLSSLSYKGLILIQRRGSCG